MRQGKLADHMPTYTVSHFAKALMSDEDADKLTAFLKAEGVPDGDPNMTIYNVELAGINITEAHFTALKSSELSLNELCSELFSEDKPDWATGGETFDGFDESETRLGDLTVAEYCAGSVPQKYFLCSSNNAHILRPFIR
eukprot:SAG22_NODE_544_length_9280_cov_9.545148_3_plen_140_part_00